MISWNFEKRFPPKFVCLSSLIFSPADPNFIQMGRSGIELSFIKNPNNERFWTNPLLPRVQKSGSMDFFTNDRRISIKIWICGEQSNFNVITKFGGKSSHQFWEIAKKRCGGRIRIADFRSPESQKWINGFLRWDRSHFNKNLDLWWREQV